MPYTFNPLSGNFDYYTSGGGLSSPLTDNLDFATYKAIALACDNGATLPASPVVGQWFLHTPTGRKILYQYNGTAWVALCSLGTMTIYIDPTNGTDSQAKGYGATTNAYASIAYAYTQIPGILNGDVSIMLASGTYTGATTLRGKFYTDNYSINIYGDYTVGADQTIASRVLATTTALGTVTVTGAGWTTDEHRGKLIKFTKIAGIVPAVDTYRVVLSNTADTLTLVGTVVTGLVANDTFGFVTFNSVLTGPNSYYQDSVNVFQVKYDPGTNYCVYAGGTNNFYRCRMESTYCVFMDSVFKPILLADCSLCKEASSGTHGIETQKTSSLTLTRTLIYTGGTVTNNAAIHVTSQTFVAFRDNSVISGDNTNRWTWGIKLEGGGVCDHRIGSFIEYCASGVLCASGSVDFSSLAPGTTYSNNTQNLTAVEGLFSVSGTLRGRHIVEGSVALSSGTATVTLSGAADAFSSATSYTALIVAPNTTNHYAVTAQTQNTFTITSSSGADNATVRYVCIGS